MEYFPISWFGYPSLSRRLVWPPFDLLAESPSPSYLLRIIIITQTAGTNVQSDYSEKKTNLSNKKNNLRLWWEWDLTGSCSVPTMSHLLQSSSESLLSSRADGIAKYYCCCCPLIRRLVTEILPLPIRVIKLYLLATWKAKWLLVNWLIWSNTDSMHVPISNIFGVKPFEN